MEKIRVGVVGLGGRGMALIRSMLACPECDVVAVCDLYEDRRAAGVKRVLDMRGNTPTAYENYEDMLADGSVDAVVIASSWDEHTRMAVAAMRAGKYTAVEVAGAYDLEDCWQLVRTYEETKTPIMLLENCCFDRFELLVTSLARSGRLGRVLYCHGAYAHELREEILGGNVARHYRLNNYLHRNCENYPTHELGPIAKLLDINRGNKMLTVSSVSTKAGVGLALAAADERSPDPTLAGREFAQGDIIVTTITCAGGEVITLRLDTTLPRTYSREFTVHGTRGIAAQEADMVLLEGACDMHEFFEPSEVTKKHLGSATQYEDYLPEFWRNATEREKSLGHGGMDYFQFKAFFRAIRNGEEMPIDVYDMAAWMAVTPLSEQSIAQGGAPQAMPDFTRGKWILRKSRDVVELPYIPAPDEGGAFGASRRDE